jgi:hypothetical protein
MGVLSRFEWNPARKPRTSVPAAGKTGGWGAVTGSSAIPTVIAFATIPGSKGCWRGSNDASTTHALRFEAVVAEAPDPGAE